MTILEKIRHNSMLYPNRHVYITEVYDELGNSIEQKITWEELENYSNRLAGHINLFCPTKKPVVVYGHKNPLMLVCFLACVKSGRAYCPIDVSVPDFRVKSVIDVVKPDLIITTEKLSGINFKYSILEKKEIEAIVINEKLKIDSSLFVKKDDVFYIIFTSGSTGIPKGVQITRDCLDNFIKWAIQMPGEEYQVFLNQAPFSFDLSVMDVYLSLYSGGTIWALNKDVQKDPKQLFNSLKKSKANVWVSTPSFADLCLAEKNFSQAFMNEIKYFLFCGEILTNKTAELLKERFPKAIIFNTYGPTESTCALTGVKVDYELCKKYNPLPVGYVKSGSFISIEDKDGTSLSDGEEGEIVIIGDSVSIGYFKRDDLNEKAFGKRKLNKTEYRVYHTGDKGYKKDGLLFYCGRLDFQIKLHGYRIEIEDVESNIMKVDKVMKAAVVPIIKNNKVSSLTAFVIYQGALKQDNSFAYAQDIKNKMKAFVPDYMIPKKIKFIDEMPITNNGKIDRKALKEML